MITCTASANATSVFASQASTITPRRTFFTSHVCTAHAACWDPGCPTPTECEFLNSCAHLRTRARGSKSIASFTPTLARHHNRFLGDSLSFELDQMASLLYTSIVASSKPNFLQVPVQNSRPILATCNITASQDSNVMHPQNLHAKPSNPAGFSHPLEDVEDGGIIDPAAKNGTRGPKSHYSRPHSREGSEC